MTMKAVSSAKKMAADVIVMEKERTRHLTVI